MKNYFVKLGHWMKERSLYWAARRISTYSVVRKEYDADNDVFYAMDADTLERFTEAKTEAPRLYRGFLIPKQVSDVFQKEIRHNLGVSVTSYAARLGANITIA